VTLARYRIAFVAIAFVCIPFARCQTADIAFSELQNKIKGHKYVLKNFSAQPTTLYHLSGDRLEPDSSPLVKAVALFSPTDLTLSGTVLTIRGQRSGLLLDRGTNSVAASPLAIEASLKIDLGTGDITAIFPALIDQLFFTNVSQALDAVPVYLRPLVPQKLVQKGTPAATCNPCTHWIRQGTWQQIPINQSGFSLPLVIKTSDPKMTRAAYAARVDVEVKFSYVVDENGRTTELWLTHAVGYGSDESGAEVIRQQVSRPAVYRGTPVAVTMSQSIHFQYR
jgi:Gram-negative bacterial TonB protein C-terminal